MPEVVWQQDRHLEQSDSDEIHFWQAIRFLRPLIALDHEGKFDDEGDALAHDKDGENVVANFTCEAQLLFAIILIMITMPDTRRHAIRLSLLTLKLTHIVESEHEYSG